MSRRRQATYLFTLPLPARFARLPRRLAVVLIRKSLASTAAAFAAASATTATPSGPPKFRGPRGGPPSPLGRASFTFRLRPPNSLPSSPAIAFAASSSFGISTNANPRARPVSRSMAMCTRVTCPNGVNRVAQFAFGGLKTHVPDKQTLHLHSP